MSRKTIKMNSRKEKTFSQVWGEFITSQTAKGVSEATIGNYHIGDYTYLVQFATKYAGNFDFTELAEVFARNVTAK